MLDIKEGSCSVFELLSVVVKSVFYNENLTFALKHMVESLEDYRLSDLERERQNPKDIALAVFRFRARRGTGVYYALLSTVPILVGVLEALSAPSYFILISVGLLVLGTLFFARWAGMKRFYQMRMVMDLFEQKQKREKQENRLNRTLESARTVLVTLLPLVAAAIFAVTGNPFLAL